MTAEPEVHSTSPDVKGVARSEAANVATTAKDGARDVAGEAVSNARSVVDEAKQQIATLFGQAQGEVGNQLSNQTSHAAVGLQSLSRQLDALSQGRPNESGPLAGYLDEAGQQVRRVAARLEEGGLQGAVDDATSFARRRPGLFLLGALGAGFAVGRLVRSGVSVAKHDDSTPDVTTSNVTTSTSLPPPMPTPFGSGSPMADEPTLVQPGVAEVPV